MCRNGKLSFEPIHAAHAIEAVTAHVRTTKPVDAITWGRILERANDLAGVLGLHVSGVESDEVEDDAVLAMVDATDRSYERSDENGLIDALILTRQEATYVSSRYTRWGKFRDRAVPALTRLAEIYGSNRGLLGVRLTYADRFVARDGTPMIGDVLAQTSGQLPSSVFKAAGAWRVEGRYEQAQPSETATRLAEHIVSFNPVGTDDDPPSLSISTMVTDIFTEEASPKQDGDRPKALSLDSRFDDLHDTLKRHLSGIITSSMASRINLFPPV